MACEAADEAERLPVPVPETEREVVDVAADRLEVAGATLLTCCEPEDVTDRLPADCDALLEVVAVAEFLEAALVTLLVDAPDALELEARLLDPFMEALREATDLPESPLSQPRP